MKYEIHSTTNGPVIFYNDKAVCLSDENSLLEICEQNLDFLADMQGHVIRELNAAMASFNEAAEANINMPAVKIYSYLSAYQQFWIFRNHNWPAYLHAVEEANLQNLEETGS